MKQRWVQNEHNIFEILPKCVGFVTDAQSLRYKATLRQIWLYLKISIDTKLVWWIKDVNI